MATEIAQTRTDPPESWTRRNGLSLTSKRARLQGENPFAVSGPIEEARTALSEAKSWLSPAEPRTLAVEVTRALMRFPRRADDPDREAMMRVMIDDLSRYPGDLVIEALREWRGDFAPTSSELCRRIENSVRFANRHAKIAALEAFIAAGGETKPAKRRITPAELDALKARLGIRSRRNEPPALTPEQAAGIARVDEAFGEKARARSRVA